MKVRIDKMHFLYPFIVILGICVSFPTLAQHRSRVVSLAVTNQHSAFPFSTFKNLFTKEFHPGVEVGYGFNWKTRARHDWYQDFKAGYFYHRFVQHAIPVYTQLGYRYKLGKTVRLTAALGAGYLHSVPATAVLELRNDGTYENAKGIGRGQALFNFTAGVQYVVTGNNPRPATVFLNYQQQLQAPFIKSYVPLLPYNSVALGFSVPLKK
jgi:hypothetical protein